MYASGKKRRTFLAKKSTKSSVARPFGDFDVDQHILDRKFESRSKSSG